MPPESGLMISVEDRATRENQPPLDPLKRFQADRDGDGSARLAWVAPAADGV